MSLVKEKDRGYLYVCNFFLEKREDARILKLMKLVYITHGIFLSWREDSFVGKDRFEAWVYGPVLPRLYHEYRDKGYDKFKEHCQAASDELQESADDTDLKILGTVNRGYGDLEAFNLVGLTHKLGSPWDAVYERTAGPQGITIPDKIIKKYYDDLIDSLHERGII